jgi:DNA-binding transcriptional LysR family regulator
MVRITIVNLSSIDLNLLLVLHTVLEERSVTRAARRLALTQPAVSNALARLRATLGDPLIVRAGRELRPTPRAIEMQARLRAGLGELAAVVDQPQFDPATTDRTFALADSEELSVLPRLAGLFARRLPRATFKLVTVDDAASALAAGSADLALGPAALAGAGLLRRPLYDDHVVRVVRRGHPHARSPARLARAPQIVVASGHAPARTDARIAMVMPDYMSAALAVSQCDHVASLPRRFARSISRLLPLQILGSTTKSFPIALYWHERTRDDPGAAAFRAIVIEAVTA